MPSVLSVKSGGIGEEISASIVVLVAVTFFMSIMDAWLGEIKAGTCNGKVISTVVISSLCCV